MANKKRKGTDFSESPFNKWCHAMNNTLSRKASVDVTHSNTSDKLHNQQDKNSCKQEIEGFFYLNIFLTYRYLFPLLEQRMRSFP